MQSVDLNVKLYKEAILCIYKKMNQTVIFLVLTLCVFAQGNVLNKFDDPCFDKKSAEIQEAADVRVSIIYC